MYLIIIVLGITAGVISGIVGTGSSIMLLPALAWTFGPKAALPIMAIASIMANISRVALWHKEIHWRAFWYYSLTAVPAVALGARTLWVIPATLSNLSIGIFFLLLVPLRKQLSARQLSLTSRQLALSGAIVGYLTGIVFSTGPLTIPLFAGYGLVKGALLSTEAAASFAVYLVKATTFGSIGAIPFPVLVSGVLVGTTLVAGSYIGKRFVITMPDTLFHRLIDVMLLIAGASMLWEAMDP